jgi:hypothetical protein
MDLFDAILLARIQFASLHQGNLGRYCQLAEWRPCEAGALIPWRFSLGAIPWRYPLALRGDTRFGDPAPRDHRLGTKRAIVR